MSAEERARYRARGWAICAAVIIPFWAVAGGLANAALSAHGVEAPPFTVTAEGVSLPDGQTFPDGGHVNIHADAPHHDLHFELKCRDRTDAECAGPLHDAAQFIGRSFIPWSGFGLTDGCVSWVQVAGIIKHFGDAGEAPICLGGTPSTHSPAPTPVASPSTAPTGIPSTTTPIPTSPTPTATAPATDEPSPSPTPTDSPTSTPEPSSNPTPASTDTPVSMTGADSRTVPPAPARLADTGIGGLSIVLVAVIFFAIAMSAYAFLEFDRRQR